MPSSTLPRRAASFSDPTTCGLRSWPPLWPSGAVVALVKTCNQFIVNNRHLIPNDGERYRNGEPIATGFVESTVNQVVRKQFCKKQQMQWSKEGAHRLLQTRVRTLNGELAGIFTRWYPDLDVKADAIPLAA